MAKPWCRHHHPRRLGQHRSHWRRIHSLGSRCDRADQGEEAAGCLFSIASRRADDREGLIPLATRHAGCMPSCRPLGQPKETAPRPSAFTQRNQSTNPAAHRPHWAVPTASSWPFSPVCRNSSKVLVDPVGGVGQPPVELACEVQPLDLANRHGLPGPSTRTGSPAAGPGGGSSSAWRLSLGSGNLQLQAFAGRHLAGWLGQQPAQRQAEARSSTSATRLDPRPHKQLVAGGWRIMGGAGSHGVVNTNP